MPRSGAGLWRRGGGGALPLLRGKALAALRALPIGLQMKTECFVNLVSIEADMKHYNFQS
jgi:hypothetical protein